MKKLLFTHKSDIDGMGNAILSRLAFKDIDYILCKNNNDLESKISDYYKNGTLYSYDSIYITDLSITKETADVIYNDNKLKNKVFVFDHHKTAIYSGISSYNNVNIRIKSDKGKSCATEIFYEYLIDNNYIKQSNILNYFVELIRREDTYEWKKYNDTESHDLAILFQSMKENIFIEKMFNKINNNSKFRFDNEELFLINSKKLEITNKIKEYLETLEIINIGKYRVGVCFITYEYRNEVATYLLDNNANMDAVAMIAMDNSAISLRSIKNDIAPRIIAEQYGGGGHDSAAAIPLTKIKRKQIINAIFKETN